MKGYALFQGENIMSWKNTLTKLNLIHQNPKERKNEIAKIHYSSLYKSSSSAPHCRCLTKHGKNHPWVPGTYGFTNKDHSVYRERIMGFVLSLSTLYYDRSFAQMFLLILTGFSGERCGPWASSFVLFLRYVQEKLCYHRITCDMFI